MNLYLIWQNTNSDYDTYSDAVVAAETPKEATQINPGGYYKFHDGAWWFQFDPRTGKKEERLSDSSWTHPKNVKVKLIGEAIKGTKAGVICSSFHAG